MKGIYNTDTVRQNRFTLDTGSGGTPIKFDTVAGLDIEVDTADMPDRTKISGGQTAPGEFTATMLAGEVDELLSLNLWLDASAGSLPGYKRTGVLTFLNLTGSALAAWEIQGMWIRKMTTPEGDVSNEGDPAKIECTFAFDEVVHLGPADTSGGAAISVDSNGIQIGAGLVSTFNKIRR